MGDRLIARYSAFVGSVIEGGSDTTSVTLQSCILMLIAHPEAQEQACREIESVVGHERLPIRDDWERLPYCQAFIKEVGPQVNLYYFVTQPDSFEKGHAFSSPGSVGYTEVHETGRVV